MKRICISLLFLFILSSLPVALYGSGYTPSPENMKAREEFSKARLGIFIHWGLYSMLGQGEWVLHNRNINYAEYAKLAGAFYPSKFNATEWAKAIKESGAGYVTITSRHHDGFSLFKSGASSYNSVDATPFARDIIGEMAEACGKEGLKLHLYYSHLDWGRCDYYPRGRTGNGTERPNSGDWKSYERFMKAQLSELLTNYGPIGAIWFDGVWDRDSLPREAQPTLWDLEAQYELIHKLQPACLIGNNHHLLPFEGEDIQIFERDIPGENEYGLSGQEVSHLPLETCQTMNRSWGYRITDTLYKSSGELVQYLVKTAAKGANLLLNIGPRPDGTLPDEALVRLRDMGAWLSAYGESVYGTDAGPLAEEPWGVSTLKGDIIYLHLLTNLKEGAARVAPVLEFDSPNRVKSVAVLGGNPLKFTYKGGKVKIEFPAEEYERLSANNPDVVVKIELR